MNIWKDDPVTKQPSVSLTFALTSFILATGFSIGEALGQVKAAAPLMELFYACAALYFGRRLQIGTKIFKSEKEEKSE